MVVWLIEQRHKAMAIERLSMYGMALQHPFFRMSKTSLELHEHG